MPPWSCLREGTAVWRPGTSEGRTWASWRVPVNQGGTSQVSKWEYESELN